MNLKALKVLRFFHLLSKHKYDEKRQIEMVKICPLFDAKWYLEQNPDVKAKKMGAAKHYAKVGWKECRNPSKDFNTEDYIRRYPELLNKNWCPLFHYMLEHKELMPKIDYKQEFLNLFKKEEKNKSADYRLLSKSKYFDKKWYLKTYSDVKRARMDPIEHYMKFGWKEGRNPGPKFSTQNYLDLNADVKKAKVNPLVHYEKYGKKEGRLFKYRRSSSLIEKIASILHLLRGKKIRKILLISHELTYTGAPLSLLKAAECFNKLGYKIETVSLKDGDLKSEFVKFGKVVITKNLNKLCLIASQCDLIIVNSLVLYAEYSALKCLLPTVWWIREPVSLLLNNKYTQMVFKNASNVYTMSEYSRQEFLPYNSKVKVIKHGLDDFYEGKKINKKRLSFAVVGSVDYRKGQDIFIDAVNNLPRRVSAKADFYIVGKVHNPCLLEKVTADNIHVLSEKQDYKELMKFYEDISCVVVPSREEPTSRVVIEAMMMGRPAVVSDHVGAQYLIDEAKTGFVFKNEDTKALGSILQRVIENPDQLIKMEELSRQAYQENNSLEVYSKNLSMMIDNTVADYTKKKMLIHLHLYYHEQLKYFISKLKNITCDYDLFVTYVDENVESNSRLEKFKKDVHLIKVPNKGYDLAPFVYVLSLVNLDDYQYILKLHTKNFRTTYWSYNNIKYIKYQWRNALVNALLGSKRIFKKNLYDLQNEFVGMIGNADLISHKGAVANEKYRLDLCQRLDYNPDLNSYIAGTMFICKSFLMKDIQNLHLTFDDFQNCTQTGVTGTLAHALESVLGHTVENNGMLIKGRKVLNFRALVDKWYALWVRFKKGRKHSDYWYIKHSKHFNKKWYLQTYPDVKQAKKDPVEHYLNFGWKEDRNPGPEFNTNWYLKRYKDVAAAKINPLLHYERNGKWEGRQIRMYNMLQDDKFLKIISEDKTYGVSKKKRNVKIIVSLTSFPARINEVAYTLYSLLHQTLKPDEIVLWLGHDKFANKEQDLPEILLKMKDRGLTIKWCKDLRSYTKLVPSLKAYPNEIIVTADDDIYYDEDWLEKLYKSYLLYPNNIHCHRVHRITFGESNNILPYKEWRQCYLGDDATYQNFLTGVGGVLYPPHSLYKDVLKSSLFAKLAPLADDIWFWAMAVLQGTKIRSIKKGTTTLKYVNPDREYALTEGATLASENVVNGRNDEQLKNVVNYYPLLLKNLCPNVNHKRMCK